MAADYPGWRIFLAYREESANRRCERETSDLLRYIALVTDRKVLDAPSTPTRRAAARARCSLQPPGRVRARARLRARARRPGAPRRRTRRRPRPPRRAADARLRDDQRDRGAHPG